MKSRHPEPIRLGADEMADALLQLARCLVGESNRQDLARSREFFPEQKGDPVRQDPRLPRPCPSQDEKRSFAVLHRLELRRVENFGERVHCTSRNTVIEMMPWSSRSARRSASSPWAAWAKWG